MIRAVTHPRVVNQQQKIKNVRELASGQKNLMLLGGKSGKPPTFTIIRQ
jgi:hypothetical protein